MPQSGTDLAFSLISWGRMFASLVFNILLCLETGSQVVLSPKHSLCVFIGHFLFGFYSSISTLSFLTIPHRFHIPRVKLCCPILCHMAYMSLPIMVYLPFKLLHKLPCIPYTYSILKITCRHTIFLLHNFCIL